MARRFYTIKNVGVFLARRDGGWYCHYCGCVVHREPDKCMIIPKPAQATVDHMTPISKGGDDGVRNMVLCCKECNEEKADMDYLTYWILTSERREQNQRSSTYAPRN